MEKSNESCAACWYIVSFVSSKRYADSLSDSYINDTRGSDNRAYVMNGPTVYAFISVALCTSLYCGKSISAEQ